LVFDEYGGLEGLVTSTDLLEAIVGNIDLPSAPLIIQRQDNSWLVDGSLPFVELLDFLEKDNLARVSEGRYQSVGGFMLSILKEVPTEGKYVNWEGFRFEVMDMDGFRVDKVIVSIIAPEEPKNA
jgi:putative hemolysin